MRFTQHPGSGINLIRGYGGGELRINELSYRETVMVSATAVATAPNIHTVQDLQTLELATVLAFDPELLLLGTGARQVFPAGAFGAQFMRRNIGFEVMDTGAACRTFNVLVEEQRRILAILLL